MADMNKGQYKKPRAINLVSITLFLLLCGAVYWGYCFGPGYLAYYQVKQLVHEAAAKYYKMSFYEKSGRAQATNDLMDATRKEIVKVLGYDDPEMTVELLINEETKAVNVVANYNRTVVLPGLNKVRIDHFKVVGESDYKHLDW